MKTLTAAATKLIDKVPALNLPPNWCIGKFAKIAAAKENELS